MSEFQLYKKRDFSAFMSDTMQFFKQFWKNYFRNFVIINGALLLLMCVLYFLFFKDMLKGIYSPNTTTSWLNDSSNILLNIGGVLLFSIVSIALFIFTTAFPMVYLKLLKTNEEETITSSDIFDEIKSYGGRIFMFGLISFFVMIPIGIIVFGIGAALSFLIIGI